MYDNFRYKYNMYCINNIKKYREYNNIQFTKNYILHYIVYEIANNKMFYNNIECDTYKNDCPCLNCRLLSDNIHELYNDKKQISLLQSSNYFKDLVKKINKKKYIHSLYERECFNCKDHKLCININNFYGFCSNCFPIIS